MINQQTLAALLSAYGPQAASLMSSPTTAAPVSPAAPSFPGGAAPPGGMAPNLSSLLAAARAMRGTGGGMFGPLQPPAQSPRGAMGAPAGGGMSPLLMAMLKQNQGNPMAGQIANSFGLAGSGAPYDAGLMGGSLTPTAADGMGFYPGF